jgi:hypothetical protein
MLFEAMSDAKIGTFVWVSRYIDEHPSLTKEQTAYAQAAAKFEVL